METYANIHTYIHTYIYIYTVHGKTLVILGKKTSALGLESLYQAICARYEDAKPEDGGDLFGRGSLAMATSGRFEGIYHDEMGI